MSLGGGGESRPGLLSPDSLGALGKLTLSCCSFPHLESQGEMLVETLNRLEFTHLKPILLFSVQAGLATLPNLTGIILENVL